MEKTKEAKNTSGRKRGSKSVSTLQVNKSEHTKKALLVALEKELGVVTAACKRADVGRTTFYEYYNNDSDFKAAADSIEDVALDFTESKLHEQIAEGNVTAIIFHLKTKGKKRGYIERIEQTGKDGEPIKILVEYANAENNTSQAT